MTGLCLKVHYIVMYNSLFIQKKIFLSVHCYLINI